MDHVLSRVGAELAEAAASLKTLQDDLGPVLTEVRAIGPTLLVKLQALDAVEQTLRDLSRFVHHLGFEGPPVDEDRVDEFLDGLTLSALARRLRARGPELAAVPESCDGDMELF